MKVPPGTLSFQEEHYVAGFKVRERVRGQCTKRIRQGGTIEVLRKGSTCFHGRVN